MARIELATSPLPRECSTTELHGQAVCNHSHPSSKTGAGEGNRTLIVSLEGFCSTIELHPRSFRGGDLPTLKKWTLIYFSQHFTFTQKHFYNFSWWREKDSNLRRLSRQIYSLIPLTAREPLQTEPTIMNTLTQ